MVVCELNSSLLGYSAKQNLYSISQLCWFGLKLWIWIHMWKKTCFQSRDVQICVTFVDYLAQISKLPDSKLSNNCLNVLSFEKQSIRASWRSRGRDAVRYLLSLSTKWMIRCPKWLQVFLKIFFWFVPVCISYPISLVIFIHT